MGTKAAQAVVANLQKLSNGSLMVRPDVQPSRAEEINEFGVRPEGFGRLGAGGTTMAPGAEMDGSSVMQLMAATGA